MAQQPSEHRLTYSEEMIRFQLAVISGLNLDPDFNTASVRYRSEGYARQCEQLVRKNPDYQQLLAQNKLQVLADLVVSDLMSWKQAEIQESQESKRKIA